MSSPDFATELAARAAQVEVGLRSKRAASFAATPAEARLWLALTPAWTLPLAEAAGFPRGDGSVESVFAALHEEGLCEVQTDALAPDDSQLRFSMPSAARAAVLTEAAGAAPSTDFGRVISTIASRIQGAKVADERVPPLLRPWAELARWASDPTAVGRALQVKVDEFMSPESSESKRPDEALAWIEAARPISEILGGAVTAAVHHQERRVDLVYRQREDERHLDRFLMRGEPNAAFERLIAGPDSEWALHFVGAGGVGKTMLLRYISSRWASRSGATTSRIDFDYVNPEFPVRAPALLLGHLMQGLRLYAGEAAHRSFSGLELKMLTLHERTRATEPGGIAPSVEKSQEMADLIDSFADAISLLPRPVVLLLDTCEELAKARLASEGLPENVAATFQILEELHDRVPWIRVVFCGRRPLACCGRGWSLPGNPYPERPYLILFELRGFTREEGIAYLAHAPAVRADLVDAILDANLDPTAPMGFICTVPPVAEPPRHIPFGLNLYAGWAREDSTLTADKIRSGDADPFIETRILGRIRRPALEELVPALAAVGRADLQLLRALSTRSAADFEEAVRELQEQDWVIQQEDGFFEVRSHLRSRLWSFLRKKGRAITGETRGRAADYLEKATVEAPLARLAISYFEAAARLLAPDPERACAWWEQVEGRFARSRELAWARRLVEFLLSEDGAVGERQASAGFEYSPLRPAVLATYAGLLLQADEPTRLDAIWQEVERHAECDPRPAHARRLLLRARAGRLVAAWLSRQPLDSRALDAFAATVGCAATFDARDERPALQLIAGFEALTEIAERGRADAPLAAWREQLCTFARALEEAKLDLGLVGFAAALAARAAYLAQDVDEAQRWWKTALNEVPRLRLATAQIWLDWRAPADPAARVRLEFALAAHRGLCNPRAALRHLRIALAPRGSIDADRLAAAVLRLRGATQPPITRDTVVLASAERSSTATPERYNAHRAVPPFFVTYWEMAGLAYGAVDNAMQALRGGFADLEGLGTAFETTQAVERARLGLARRMRLRDEERISLPPLVGLSDVETVDAVHTLLAFDARSRAAERLAKLSPPADADGPARAQWIHRHWRTIPAASARDARFALAWAEQMRLDDAGSDDPGTAACLLDAIEANCIAGHHLETLPFPRFPGNRATLSRVASLSAKWLAATPLAPEAHLRLLLRLGALGYGGTRHRREIERLADACGKRRAATIAQDEGELLALRLPEAAAWVLVYARFWFMLTRDFAGALVAACCRALAAIRAEQSGEVVAVALGEARNAYERLIRGEGRPEHVRFLVPVLPQWRELQRIAQKPTISELDGLSAVDWRPWLVRLVAALAWQRDGDAYGWRTAVIGEWIATKYGVVDAEADEGRRLPPELAPWRTGAKGESSAALTRRTHRELAVQVTVQGEAPLGSRTTSVRLLLAMASQSQGGDAGQPAILEGTLDRALRYRDVATTGFPPVGVANWIEGLSGVRRIDLWVDPAVADGGWEALIARWLIYDRQATLSRRRLESAERSLCFARHPPRQRGGRSLAAIEIRQMAGLIAEPVLARQVSKLWSGELAPRNGEFHCTDTLRYGWSKKPPDAVHVVGWPVISGHGDLALQLDTASSDGAAVIYSSGTSERGGALVRAADLREHFPSAEAVVLQAKPTFGGARTLTDQECACLLRSLAADLAGRGVPCVVTIPPLPMDDALKSLEGLAGEVLGTGETSEASWIDAVQAARKAARKGRLLKEDDRRDAGWDFCLYLA